jgi:hypothetical protein
MTIQQVLDKIKYGDDYIYNEESKSTILKNLDEDTGAFFGSNRIEDIAKTMFFESQDDQILRKIGHLKMKLSSLEDRIFSNKTISESYKKAQTISILNDWKTIMESANNSYSYKKIHDKEKLAKILATAKYSVSKYISKSNVFTESTNPLFNAMIKREEENMEVILG